MKKIGSPALARMRPDPFGASQLSRVRQIRKVYATSVFVAESTTWAFHVDVAARHGRRLGGRNGRQSLQRLRRSRRGAEPLFGQKRRGDERDQVDDGRARSGGK